MAKAIGGRQTDDNDAFDVLAGSHTVEVKTIVSGKNPKITMHPESLRRKQRYARKNGVKAWTVAIDRRSGKPEYYVKEKVGSFRLSAMEKVGSLKELRERIGA